MRGLETLLESHPFFRDLDPETVKLIAECGKNALFDAGEFLAREGDDADVFYILREGKVAVQLHSPQKGGVTLQTLDAGEIVGWSWLFPPYEWHFDVRAVESVRAVALDGACLRRKCDEDPALGYQLMKKFSQFIVQRLKASRMQVLDLYKR